MLRIARQGNIEPDYHTNWTALSSPGNVSEEIAVLYQWLIVAPYVALIVLAGRVRWFGPTAAVAQPERTVSGVDLITGSPGRCWVGHLNNVRAARAGRGRAGDRPLSG